MAAALGRRPGIGNVEVNPVAQSANVGFDPALTSLVELRRWVHECGCHCSGQLVPTHLCHPMAEPGTGHEASDPAAAAPGQRRGNAHEATHVEHGQAGQPEAVQSQESAAPLGRERHNGHGEAPGLPSAQEVMGHGGHVGRSMAAMAADMRNRVPGGGAVLDPDPGVVADRP